VITGAKPKKRFVPYYNSAALFETCDHSFHAMRHIRICCTTGNSHLVTYGRRSINLYYLTPARPGVTPRKKAFFVPRPLEPRDEVKDRLRTIRLERRLTRYDVPTGWVDPVTGNVFDNCYVIPDKAAFDKQRNRAVA